MSQDVALIKQYQWKIFLMDKLNADTSKGYGSNPWGVVVVMDLKGQVEDLTIKLNEAIDEINSLKKVNEDIKNIFK